MVAWLKQLDQNIKETAKVTAGVISGYYVAKAILNSEQPKKAVED